MKRKINNVPILGTEYNVFIVDEKGYKQIKDKVGCCDSSSKDIYLHKSLFKREEGSVKHLMKVCEEVLTHEIVHAFIYESGLGESYQNETLIDWISIQLEKIIEAKKVNKFIEKEHTYED